MRPFLTTIDSVSVRRISCVLRSAALPILGLIACLAALPAAADVVNLTTGQRLFFDSFERQPANKVSHRAYPDDADAAPTGDGGAGGSYVVRAKKHTNVQVTNRIGGDEPGAYSGKNCLRIGRGDVTNGEVFQVFKAEQVRPRDRIHVSLMVCASDADVSIHLFDKAMTARRITFKTDRDGDVAYYTAAKSWASVSGVQWTPHRWQRWEIDYAIGAATCTLAIDGKSRSNIPVCSAGPVGSVLLGSGWGTSPAYFDEQFPEPPGVAIVPRGEKNTQTPSLRTKPSERF
ncbi:MAG: hypothetical protein ABFC96_02015 [Thermoguttaceae bacterium]